jgi:hypothetical protein
MNGLEIPVCPVRNSHHLWWGSYNKLQFLTERARVKAPSFLTGFTQIALTRLGLTHLLSMKLNLSD